MRVKAYIILLIQAASLLQPLSPYVDYYVNQDYIQEFLCQNRDDETAITVCAGKCYLGEQLKEQQEEQGPDTLIKSIGIYTFQLSGFVFEEEHTQNARELSIPDYNNQYSYLAVSGSFKPPRV